MSTENIRNMDFNIEQQELEETVNKILKSEHLRRLNEEDFIDIYGEQVVRNDLKAVKRLEETDHPDYLNESELARHERGKRRSEALEVIISEQGEFNDWLGPDALMIRTSEYDDRLNGVDVIIEFNPEEQDEQNEIERIALAVDASMRPNYLTVNKKISRNINKLFGKQSMEVKYFQSRITEKKGKLRTIIPVVVGIEGDNANELMKSVVQVSRLEQSELAKENSPEITKEVKEAKRSLMDKLTKHPAQIIFLEEIADQLKMYLALIDKRPSEKPILSKDKIQSLLDLIESIIASKEDIKKDLESKRDFKGLKEDGVFGHIREVIESKKH